MKCLQQVLPKLGAKKASQLVHVSGRNQFLVPSLLTLRIYLSRKLEAGDAAGNQARELLLRCVGVLVFRLNACSPGPDLFHGTCNGILPWQSGDCLLLDLSSVLQELFLLLTLSIKHLARILAIKWT